MAGLGPPTGPEADWELARQEFEHARPSPDTIRIIDSAVELAFRSAVLLAVRSGVAWPASKPLSAALADQMRIACEDHLAGNPLDADVELASDVFGLVASIEIRFRRPRPGQRTSMTDIGAAFLELGEKSVLLGWAIDRMWAKFHRAQLALDKLSQGGRNKIPLWRKAFLPVARQYCEHNDDLSLGELVRRARDWADQERQASRNVGLPATDDGIKAGLKRMVKAGELCIPGYQTRG